MDGVGVCQHLPLAMIVGGDGGAGRFEVSRGAPPCCRDNTKIRRGEFSGGAAWSGACDNSGPVLAIGFSPVKRKNPDTTPGFLHNTFKLFCRGHNAQWGKD